MPKKACRKCKIFVDGNECPICHGNQMTTNWQGRLHIIDTKKSMIANKIGMNVKGEYAIKVR